MKYTLLHIGKSTNYKKNFSFLSDNFAKNANININTAYIFGTTAKKQVSTGKPTQLFSIITHSGKVISDFQGLFCIIKKLAGICTVSNPVIDGN